MVNQPKFDPLSSNNLPLIFNIHPKNTNIELIKLQLQRFLSSFSITFSCTRRPAHRSLQLIVAFGLSYNSKTYLFCGGISRQVDTILSCFEHFWGVRRAHHTYAISQLDMVLGLLLHVAKQIKVLQKEILCPKKYLHNCR